MNTDPTGACAGSDPPGRDRALRVVLADDSEDLRHMLGLQLELAGGLELVASVGDGDEAVRAVDELLPDVALLDIAMPRLSGIEATSQLRGRHPRLRIVIVTAYSRAEMLTVALDAGADDVVEKGTDVEELVATVCASAGIR